MLKETAYGIAATIAHPIDAGVAILHSTKKTVSQVGYLGGVFVQGVGYAFGGKQIEVNQEEFDKTAQDLSKSMVKTGVLAVVTAGVGEAAGAAVKTKAVANSAKIIDTNLKALSREAATAVKGGADSNFKLLKDRAIKDAGFDAHAIKKEILGNKAEIAKFDLYKDNVTSEVLILRKKGLGEPIPTGYFIPK